LVFEGTGSGTLEAFRANTGEKLWSAPTQSGVTAAPVAYSVNGQEYIAVLVGWGGVLPLVAGEIALQNPRMPNTPRMLAFKLGGTATLPPAQESAMRVFDPPRETADTATIKMGEALYQRYCGACHGDVAVSGGVLPDLRYSKMLAEEQWLSIVIDGALRPAGMISFAKELTRDDARAIRSYVIFRVNQSFAETASARK
jgi:alcohol dehydrogenase (cytochrome c)/quinohemoprotein ethanol dehydrogenase